jgi:hypothetical protein
MATPEDIDYFKTRAVTEVNTTYNCLDELLQTLRLLKLNNHPKYAVLTDAFKALSIIERFGMDVFENNSDEHEHNEKEW